ncbi:MAG: adenosylmethionine decarboxylase [Victivallaceae bacterium]|nr:adenosylmethionine decarboxylase [Victivallaceae bacterium]
MQTSACPLNAAGCLSGAVTALGRHLTVEFYDCDSAVLADDVAMERAFVHAAKASGAHVLFSYFHEFEPQGVSGVVIISESHFAVHAWPEHDYAAVDIFTCGESIDFDRAISELKDSLKSGSVMVSRVMNRGVLSPFGIEKLPATDVAPGRTLSYRGLFEQGRAASMTLSLGLYHCAVARLGEAALTNKIREVFCELAPMLPKELSWERFATSYVFGGDSARASLHGRVSVDTVHLDFSLDRFFEPRETAERVLVALEGSHYRMQVTIRN